MEDREIMRNAFKHGYSVKEWTAFSFEKRELIKSLFEYWKFNEKVDSSFWKEHGEYNISKMVDMAKDNKSFSVITGDEIQEIAEHFAAYKEKTKIYKKGGNMKQSQAQYKREKYGSQDKKRMAKPVGFRYKKIRDKKSGRLRDVTKDDKEYYQTPSQKLIKAYKDGDKTARKMIYFEKRADHSDKEPKNNRKFKSGGNVEYKGVEIHYDLSKMPDNIWEAIYVLNSRFGDGLVSVTRQSDGAYLMLSDDKLVSHIFEKGNGEMENRVWEYFDAQARSYTKDGRFVNEKSLGGFLLGAAAGVGAMYFLNKPKGESVKRDIATSNTIKREEIEETWQDVVRGHIEKDGFEYAFLHYSKYNDVNDKEFHKLRNAYVNVSNKFIRYIEKYKNSMSELYEKFDKGGLDELAKNIPKKSNNILKKYSASYIKARKKLADYIGEDEYAKGGKLTDGTPLYTSDELLKKFKGKFIDVYPHHYEYRNPKTHQYETVYEVRGISKQIKENYQSPEEIIFDEQRYTNGGELNEMTDRIQNVLQHYVHAALWSSVNIDNEEEEFLDENYSIDDIDEGVLKRMVIDIHNFIKENDDAIKQSGMSDEQLGHDLWLTRNGHGAGFWDRGYDEVISEKLTSAAMKMGGFDLYVGDDGKLHSMQIYKNGGSIVEVRCNNCDWEGTEDELKLLHERGDGDSPDEFNYYKGCPNCETDDYLMDVKRKGGRVKWIQRALSGGKNKGALRRTAMRKGLLRNKNEKLSMTDLKKLEKMGGKIAKRAVFAKTLRSFEEGGFIASKDIYYTLPKDTPVHKVGTNIVVEKEQTVKYPHGQYDLYKVYMESDGEKYWHIFGLSKEKATDEARRRKNHIQAVYDIATYKYGGGFNEERIQLFENISSELMQGNEVSSESLQLYLGRIPNYEENLGGLKMRKCFLKPTYKILK